MALAEYARTGADVLFVINYPAYVGVAPADADPAYAEANPGLGFRYSAAQARVGRVCVCARARSCVRACARAVVCVCGLRRGQLGPRLPGPTRSPLPPPFPPSLAIARRVYL